MPAELDPASPHSAFFRSRRSSKRMVFALAFLLVVGGVYWVTHRGGNGMNAGAPSMAELMKKPVPVIVSPVSMQSVPVVLTTIGNTEPMSTVALKPQVTGRLESIHFVEGQYVQPGQILFTLDSRPFEAAYREAQATLQSARSQVQQLRANVIRDEAAVRQAQANLSRDTAQLTYAESQVRRYASLLQQEYISRDQYEQSVANRDAARSVVAASRAAVENANAQLLSDRASVQTAVAQAQANEAIVENRRLELGYTTIRAPFYGRTGSFRVHAGDMIQANTTELVTLDKTNPIYVSFSVPEAQLAEIKRRQAVRPLTVNVTLKNSERTRLTGRLTFVNNAVDQTTGTIRLKALFDNADRRLWPGQFMDVELVMGIDANMMVVPASAIQTGQKGDYVFRVVDGKAEYQDVKVVRVVEDRAVISSGLNTGDTVVTDGQMQLSPGQKVTLKRSLSQE